MPPATFCCTTESLCRPIRDLSAARPPCPKAARLKALSLPQPRTVDLGTGKDGNGALERAAEAATGNHLKKIPPDCLTWQGMPTKLVAFLGWKSPQQRHRELYAFG